MLANHPTLESQIDALYQAPLDAFTASRNALAKTLGKADAARVRKLPKPPVIPWAINQLYWKARPTWDRLLKSGVKLRAVQLDALDGRAGDIRQATASHRAVLSDAARTAGRIAAQSGSAPPPDALVRALEALSLMKEWPERAGRLTQTPRPAGFEALTGEPVRPRLVAEARPKPDTSAAREPVAGSVRLQPDLPKPDPRQEAAARRRAAAAAKQQAAALEKREAALRQAEGKVARAKAQAALARGALERAEKAVAAAQADLTVLKFKR